MTQNPAHLAIKGTTQDFLEIADIRDDLVLMSDGSIALVIQTSAVNFSLLSEVEQGAIIAAYAEFLNSLNFAVQIVIRTQRKDISSYLSYLEKAENKQDTPANKEQLHRYREYIARTVKENNVLDKKFFVVIPFSSLELGAGTITGGLLRRQPRALPLPAETIIARALPALNPKRDHVLRQLSRLGLRARQLTTPELVNLFYEIYNPGRDRVKNEELKMKS